MVATEDSLDHYGGEEGVARVAATVPLAGFGTPADIADAVAVPRQPAGRLRHRRRPLLHGGGEWPAFLRAAEG